jgi:hypothetical protein
LVPPAADRCHPDNLEIIMQTFRHLDPVDPAGTPIHHNDHLIGYLVEDAERRYRFAALDEHFNLLDGSRFVAPHRALAAVARLSQFIDHPVAANEA